MEAGQGADNGRADVTMMLRAAALGDVRFMRVLLESSRALDVRNSNGSTPLHVRMPACGRVGAGPAAVAGNRPPSSTRASAPSPDRRREGHPVHYPVPGCRWRRCKQQGARGRGRQHPTASRHPRRFPQRTWPTPPSPGLAGAPRVHIRSPSALIPAQVVKALLEAGADPDAQDASGRSALHVAAIEGAVPVAKLLIARGADLNLRDGAGFNVSFLAQEYGREAILDLPGLPAPSSASVEERYAAHCMRAKRARELAELAKAAKGTKGKKGKGKGKGKKKKK